MSLTGYSEQPLDLESSTFPDNAQNTINNAEDVNPENDSENQNESQTMNQSDGDDGDDDEDEEGTMVLIRFADMEDQEEDEEQDSSNTNQQQNDTENQSDANTTHHDQQQDTNNQQQQQQQTSMGDPSLEGYVEESDYDFTADITPRGRTESVSNYDKKLMDVQNMAQRQQLEFERGRNLQASQPRSEPRRVFKESNVESENQRKREEDEKRRQKKHIEITKMCVYYDLSLIRTETDIQHAMEYLRGKIPQQVSHLFDSNGNIIESQLFSTTTAPAQPTNHSVSHSHAPSEVSGDGTSVNSKTDPVSQTSPSATKSTRKQEAAKDKVAKPLPDYLSPDYQQPITFNAFLEIIRSQVPHNLKARFPKDGLLSGKGYKKQEHPILFYHQYIFDTKFDPTNRLHVLLLNSVYMRLMEETTPPPLIGDHWVKNHICCDENPANSLKVRGIVDLIKPRLYKGNDLSIYPLFVALYLLDGVNDPSATNVFRILLRNIHQRSEPAPEVCIFDFFVCISYVMRFYHHKCVSKFIPQIIVDYNKDQYRYVRGERNFESYLFYMIEFLAAGLLTKYYRNYLTLNTLISAAISLREMLFNDARGLERLLHDPVPAGTSRALVSFVPGSYELFLSEINDDSYYQLPLSVPFLTHLRKRGIDIKKEEHIQSKYKPTQGAEISTHRSSLYVPVIQQEKPEREVGKPNIHRNDGKSTKGGKKTPPPPPVAAAAAATTESATSTTPIASQDSNDDDDKDKAIASPAASPEGDTNNTNDHDSSNTNDTTTNDPEATSSPDLQSGIDMSAQQ